MQLYLIIAIIIIQLKFRLTLLYCIFNSPQARKFRNERQRDLCKITIENLKACY